MEKAFSLKGNATAKVHKVVDMWKHKRWALGGLPRKMRRLPPLAVSCFWGGDASLFFKGYWLDKQPCTA